MDPLSPAQLRLNLDTRELHAAADEGWAFLRQLRIRRRDYIDQLIVTYGFESSVESAFAYTPGLRAVMDLRERARAGLIAQDLIAAGMSALEVAQLPQLSLLGFDSVREALGWMYVTERATLHFDALRRWLLRSLGPATPTAYLRAYDGIASARWSQFGRVLDAECSDEPGMQQVLSGARRGFEVLARWSEQVRPSLRSRSVS
ncbi:MAG: biliverdin-producing heme oxygenase [Kofleriaceae bacterium]|nr:biliverdin-producing heme oxygenase [Kofleriaceae bacterium]